MRIKGGARTGPVWAVVFLMASVAASGCMGGDSANIEGVESGTVEDGFGVCGIVVDAEFFPVAGATVGIDPGEHRTTSDANGTWCLGPIDAFTKVEVWVEANGFQPFSIELQVQDQPPETIVVTLASVPGQEPYEETIPHVAFIECAWASSFLGTLPCNPVDRTLGTQTTVDNSQYFFEIPAPGLAAMLFEAKWESQPLGDDMRFILLIPDIVESNYATGDPMLDGRGGSPYATWLYPGEEGERASQAFVGNESTPYQMLYRPWVTNSTLGVFAVYINHRVESYYTFFYHREGPTDFTALPDE